MNVEVVEVKDGFKVITTYEKRNFKQEEIKSPKEFLEWYKGLISELSNTQAEKIRLEELSKQGIKEETMKNYELIKAELDKIKDLEQLKSFLAEVFSGVKQAKQKQEDLKKNVKYLKDKLKNLRDISNKTKKFYLKVKRLAHTQR